MLVSALNLKLYSWDLSAQVRYLFCCNSWYLVFLALLIDNQFSTLANRNGSWVLNVLQVDSRHDLYQARKGLFSCSELAGYKINFLILLLVLLSCAFVVAGHHIITLLMDITLP